MYSHPGDDDYGAPKVQAKKADDQQEEGGASLVEKRDAPFEFTVSDGSLLWGQASCLNEASLAGSHEVDDADGAKRTRVGGTILQRDHCYRMLAKNGKWEVQRFQIRGYEAGFIAAHVACDKSELMLRAMKVGISNMNDHADRTIKYINRYDWSWSHGGEEQITEALSAAKKKSLGKESPATESEIEKLMSGYCVLINPSAYSADLLPGFVRAHGSTAMISKEGSKEVVGCYLSSPHTEYELAWIIFDRGSPAVAIGFIYDSTYCALELDHNESLSLNHQVIFTRPSMHDEVYSDEEDDPEWKPSKKTRSNKKK